MSTSQMIHDFIDATGRMAFDTTVSILNNQTVQETTETICNFLGPNYELAFTVAAIWQVVSSPVLLTLTSFALGYWLADKEIMVIPGGTFKVTSLFDNTTIKCMTLVLAFLVNFVIDRAVATLCLLALVGAVIKLQLINSIGPRVEHHQQHI